MKPVQFLLGWEGKETKRMPQVVLGERERLLIYPFSIKISSYEDENNFHGLVVSAIYEPNQKQPIEVGRTANLRAEELTPILKEQIPHIKDSAER